MSYVAILYSCMIGLSVYVRIVLHWDYNNVYNKIRNQDLHPNYRSFLCFICVSVMRIRAPVIQSSKAKILYHSQNECYCGDLGKHKTSAACTTKTVSPLWPLCLIYTSIWSKSHIDKIWINPFLKGRANIWCDEASVASGSHPLLESILGKINDKFSITEGLWVKLVMSVLNACNVEATLCWIWINI